MAFSLSQFKITQTGKIDFLTQNDISTFLSENYKDYLSSFVNNIKSNIIRQQNKNINIFCLNIKSADIARDIISTIFKIEMDKDLNILTFYKNESYSHFLEIGCDLIIGYYI